MVRFSDLKKLIWAIALCQLAGVIGSIFTVQAIPTWYADLNKPAFSPPNWVFGPAWIGLYTLMGIALYLIWQKTTKSKFKGLGLKLFYSQLALNAVWSMLFFGLKSPVLGFVDIVFLWISIVLTIYYFAKTSRVAALLLVPYIVWVSFASVLNFFIWQLNF